MAGTTTFTPLSDDVFDESLDLPIKDRTWHIVSPPAELGLRVSRLVAGAMNVSNKKDPTAEQIRAFQFNDEEEERLMLDLLGEENFTEMRAMYSWAILQHVLETVILWVAFNAEVAVIFWQGGPKENRAARRSKKTRAKK